MKNRKISE